MGKFRKQQHIRARGNIHKCLDQHDVSNGPVGSQSRSLRDVGLDADDVCYSIIASRNDSHNCSENNHTNSLSQRQRAGGLIDKSLGIYRSETPEIRRSFNAADINPILNDADVFPFISLPEQGFLDATVLLLDQRNVLLVVEGGGIIFMQHEPGIYEAHTNFLKTHRGRYALNASLSAYQWMFTHTDCMKLLTRVPAFNKGAERFCLLVGAVKEFERAAVWPTEDGAIAMSYWSLPFDTWIKQTDSLLVAGHKFHEKAEAEYARLGKLFPGHPEDEFHDRMAGACCEMIYGGQPEKAVILYNRYACFAGYPGISLISKNPLLIDTGDAVLQVFDHDFKMISIRCP